MNYISFTIFFIRTTTFIQLPVLIQLSVLIQLPMLIQLSSETRNILRYRQIISEGFIYDMLVEKYVVPPRNSNRKFTVSKKTIRRADCIEWVLSYTGDTTLCII